MIDARNTVRIIKPTYVLWALLNPVGWKTPTLGTKRVGPKIVPYAAPNAEVATFQRALQEQFENQWEDKPLECPVAFEWHFARQRSRYQTPTGRWVTKNEQDLTNLVKSAEDALQPWLLKNDKQVKESHAFIDRQAADVDEPYVVLGIQILSDL